MVLDIKWTWKEIHRYQTETDLPQPIQPTLKACNNVINATMFSGDNDSVSKTVFLRGGVLYMLLENGIYKGVTIKKWIKILESLNIMT